MMTAQEFADAIQAELDNSDFTGAAIPVPYTLGVVHVSIINVSTGEVATQATFEMLGDRFEIRTNREKFGEGTIRKTLEFNTADLRSALGKWLTASTKWTLMPVAQHLNAQRTITIPEQRRAGVES